MNSRMPPRYLPTLTEVVYPRATGAQAQPSDQKQEPTWEPVQDEVPIAYTAPEPGPAPAPDFMQAPEAWDAAPFAAEPSLDAELEAAQVVVPAPEPQARPIGTAPASAVPDRHALAQQLIKLVQPQLEAELRSIAMELFEAQFSALLPSLQLHIEEAVREALEQALPPQADYKD